MYLKAVLDYIFLQLLEHTQLYAFPPIDHAPLRSPHFLVTRRVHLQMMGDNHASERVP